MLNKKIMALTLIFVSLLAIGMVSAADNTTLDIVSVDETTDEPICVEYSDNDVGVESSGKLISTENNWTNIYFDASASVDGNGSYENPYNCIGYGRINSNSNLHFKNGNYSLGYGSYSNISFYGQNPEKTIIDFQDNQIQLYNSIFIMNMTFKKSVLYVYNNIAASNSIFDGCCSDYNQPVIYSADWGCKMLFDNCTFINNYNEWGGALNLDDSNVDILNCKFINNSANIGGAIYSRLSNLNISNTLFKNNHANVSAGAIFYQEKQLSISNCNFVNNSAYSGGAIYSNRKASTVIINETLFNDNHAFAGGSILDFESDNFYLNNCNFTNSSSIDGGALTLLGTHSNINNCNFEENHAEYGGSIYHIWGQLNLVNSIFTNNTANNGGGIFIFTMDNVNITENHFINNNGYSIVSDKEILNYQNNNFVNNSIFLNYKPNITIGNGNYTLLKTNDTFDGVIPERYDPRDFGLITSARNQNPMGYCWVFGTIATLESCILKATGEKFDFSELNVANLLSRYSFYGGYYSGEEGVSRSAIAYLLNWLGPIDEKNDLYYSNKPLSSIFNSLFHLQNVMYIQRDNSSDLNTIKEAILRYGAVGSDICFSGDYFNGFTYYNPNNDIIDHAISIVGWDDNYPKENFKITPLGDGAWIIKNSWGEADGNGCYYVSYYDTTIGNSGLYTFIFNDTIKFDKNYQYDFDDTLPYPFSNSSVWYKNIFNISDDEYLAAVSTDFHGYYDWELYIYVNGKITHTQSGRLKNGYYTINLDKFIPLNKHDKLEVVFKLTCLDNYYAYYPVMNYKFNDFKGKSFISQDNLIWIDLSDYENKPMVSCIKAFTFLNKIKTNINLDIKYNDYNPVNITAYLLDEYGNKINSGNVTFDLSGEKYVVNVSKGAANIVHDFNKGLNLISAIFNGDGYKSSCSNQSITVLKIDVGANINVTTHLNTAVINVSTSPEITGNGIIHIEDKNYIINLTKGFGNLTLNDLENKEYSIYFELENKTYECNISKNFTIKFSKTKLIVENFTTYAYSNEKYIIKLTNETGNISGKIINIKFNNQTFKYATNVNGQVEMDINLTSGIYSISVYFKGDDEYLSNECNATITVNKVDSTLTVNNITFDYNMNGTTIISYAGAAGVNAEVLNHKEAVVNVDGNVVSVSGLNAGTYTLSITTIPDNNHISITKTATITVNKIKTVLSVSPITATYNINKDLVIALKDINGKPLTDVKLSVDLNGAKNYTIGSAGQIKVSTKGLTPKTYAVTISFAGNDNYERTVSSVKVTVKKATPKLTAKAKTFKRTLKTKKYTITLKTNQNKVMKNIKVTLKVNKKTYTAKTNGKGVATFKITKLTKKGTFKAVITYKGNSYYNKVTKKVNIKCR